LRLWIVVRPNGEHFLVEKEPLEGILGWAAGQHLVVLEYGFIGVVYEKIEAPP
jgi:hypothetical protein